ncbi:hypothetical protein ACE1OC_40295 [Streptomyces sp. DSM 116496]|uniref:hypothetical protein n=1 Tax=Streptomyces stoeckheimensis TaxID=3344656 RepID=UPI0038B2F343
MITYTLKADATTAAWKLRTSAVYQVYTYGTGNPEKTSDFAVARKTPVKAGTGFEKYNPLF